MKHSTHVDSPARTTHMVIMRGTLTRTLGTPWTRVQAAELGGVLAAGVVEGIFVCVGHPLLGVVEVGREGHGDLVVDDGLPADDAANAGGDESLAEGHRHAGVDEDELELRGMGGDGTDDESWRLRHDLAMQPVQAERVFDRAVRVVPLGVTVHNVGEV